MADFADLLPDSASRVGGSGSPLFLAHDVPQTAATWHRVAARLPEVVSGLRGYGWASAPASRDAQVSTERALSADPLPSMADLAPSRLRSVAGAEPEAVLDAPSALL